MKAVWFAGALALAGAAVMAEQPAASPAPATEQVLAKAAKFPSGYLDHAALPDSIALLPAPPADDSTAFARDEEASKRGLALHGTARWDLATSDADLFTPKATEALSCAAGFEVSPETTPATARLLRRAMIDLGVSTGGAKNKYQRPRPFMENGQPTCTPSFENYLRKDGSYPSGHSAIGYGWGLIMAELVPGRATQLVARGRAFGDSRRVCNVHWLSDVEEGRIVATATVAELHSVPAFQDDLKAAQKEIAAGNLPAPTSDCAKEAEALAEG
ncbi:MAG: phosphatase PAP2 family protein [Novosphingobium sp.]|nr:phosphatase PAP2 family protein [Novosphingobium sp.]